MRKISGLLSHTIDFWNPTTVLPWSSIPAKEVMKETNELIEMYRSYLAEEGFSSKVLDDGVFISFKFEGRVYYIQVHPNDDQFFKLRSLVIGRFDPVSEVELLNNVKDIVIDLAHRYKVVKFGFALDDKDGFVYIYLSIEMFLSPPESFKPVFMRSIQILANAIKEYYEELKVLNEE